MEKDQKIRDKHCSVGTRANRSPCSCPTCGNHLYMTEYSSLYCLHCECDIYVTGFEDGEDEEDD